MYETPLKRRIRYILPNCLLPLAAGLLLYWIFRPDVWIVRRLPLPAFPHTPEGSRIISRAFLSICRYYLPDMLWAFSLTGACCLILERPIPSLASGCGTQILFELFQLWGLFPGTFDPVDMILGIFSSALAIFLRRKQIQNQGGKQQT